jgi:hypothetical protein
MSIRARHSAYALLADGTATEIRPARPGDFECCRPLYQRNSRTGRPATTSAGTATLVKFSQTCRKRHLGDKRYEKSTSETRTYIAVASELSAAAMSLDIRAAARSCGQAAGGRRS